MLAQITEIPLGELHLAITAADVAVGVRGVRDILPAGSGVDGDVTHNDGVLLIVLHHGGVQHIEGVQGGLLTGDSLRAHKVVVAVVQADADSLLDDVHGPVGAGVALDGAVIAQSASSIFMNALPLRVPVGRKVPSA